jgi:capsular polysaccharide biosynthesis protein
MEEETSLRELLEVIFAGKWIIMGFTIIMLLFTGTVTFFLVEPKYEAKTVLVFNTMQVPESYQDTGRLETLIDNYSGALQVGIQDYIALAKSEAVLTRVVQRLQTDHQEMSLKVLAEKIKIFNLLDTNLLEITVKDSSPQLATEIANAFAKEFADYVRAENNRNSQKILTLLEEQREIARADFVSSVEEMNNFLKEPDNIVKREQLQFRLDMAKQSYAFYERKHRELVAAEAMGLAKSSVTIVSEADQPIAPVAPRKKLSLGIGVCLGMLLGIFAVTFRRYWVVSGLTNKQSL